MRIPQVRVFLLTFRRPGLLPRALESLRTQSFTDWSCELHNGDPADPNPGQLLARLGDSRFRLVTPPHRTGPVEAFNLAHVPATEPYQSILEDDNWWQPDFLERLVATLEAHPQVELAWSNMRIWEEQVDATWRDTGRCVWRVPADSPPRLFHWPQLIHFSDFLYSNGAMLLRSRAAARLIMPADTPRDMIEHTRERMMSFPLLFVPQPLANFAHTRQTFRSRDHLGWARSQALLGAAFLAHVPMSDAAGRTLWARRRATGPRSTNGLFFSALLERRYSFLKYATAGDWLAFAKGVVRRPGTAWRVLRAKRDLPGVWRFVSAQTAARTAEARTSGFVRLELPSLIDKSDLAEPATPGRLKRRRERVE